MDSAGNARHPGTERRQSAACQIAREYVAQLQSQENALGNKTTIAPRSSSYAYEIAIDVIDGLHGRPTAQRPTPDLNARLSLLQTDGIQPEDILAATRVLGSILRSVIRTRYPEVSHEKIIEIVECRIQADIARAVTDQRRPLAPGQHEEINTAAAKENHVTARESEVLLYLTSGAEAKEIARLLHMSINTFKHHVTSLDKKLGGYGREHLIERAHALGIIVIAHAAAAATVVADVIDRIS